MSPPRSAGTAASAGVVVGICGPQRLIRAALAEALAAEPDLEIVAVKRTVDNLAVAAGTVALHAVVILPEGGDADAVISQAAARFPGALMVVIGPLSASTPQLSQLVCLDRITTTAGDVGRAVRSAGPTSSRRIGVLRSLETQPRRAALTDREIQVLRLVSDGLTSAEIGERLGISPRTVGRHRQSIYSKLGVGSQATAVATAVSAGLLAAAPSRHPAVTRP